MRYAFFIGILMGSNIKEVNLTMTMRYTPRGVCSQLFEIEVEDGVIQTIRIAGGCDGNLQGIAMLLRGMPVQEAVGKLKGIKCGIKQTSCPDQLATALETIKE